MSHTRVKSLEEDKIKFILLAMHPENRTAIKTAISTGLRIGDILSLKRADVEKGRFTVKEQKTGKARRITLGKGLQSELLAAATARKSPYIFPNARDINRHRTRQAVYMDIQRVASALRIKNIGTHSARKTFAVRAFHRTGDIKRVQSLLNHSSAEVTLLYALADKL
jgi:integrase